MPKSPRSSIQLARHNIVDETLHAKVDALKDALHKTSVTVATEPNTNTALHYKTDTIDERYVKKARMDSSFWRYLAWVGAARFPVWWLRLTPPPIGVVAAVLSPKKCQKVHRNLRQIVGKRSFFREHIDVIRTFIMFAQCLSETLAQKGNCRREATVRVIGQQILHEALQLNRGVILGTAHTAGWENVLVALEKVTEVPVLVVMRPERDPQAVRYHPLAQPSEKRRVVHMGSAPLDALVLLHHLRAGGLVAMQLDRCPAPLKGVQVQLANKRWTIPQGAFVLSAATGAPIVMVLSCRKGFLQYELKLVRLPPVQRAVRSASTKEKNQIHERAASQVAELLLQHVTAHPTQWFDFETD